VADFIAKTFCEPAVVKNEQAVKQIIAKYDFDVEVSVQHGKLFIHGHDWFRAYNAGEGNDIAAEDMTEKFLLEIKPHIALELVLQMVGLEKLSVVTELITVNEHLVTRRCTDGNTYRIMRITDEKQSLRRFILRTKEE